MSDSLSWPLEGESATPILWQGLVIGRLANGIWRKEITKRNQWCRRYDAPGVQARPWDSYYARGMVRSVEVLDKPNKCIFRLSAEEFNEHAVRDVLAVGAGEQLFVPREFWEVEYVNGHQLGLLLPAEKDAVA